jgi:hypothetical protein
MMMMITLDSLKDNGPVSKRITVGFVPMKSMRNIPKNAKRMLLMKLMLMVIALQKAHLLMHPQDHLLMLSLEPDLT